jgi:hypothetical protein
MNDVIDILLDLRDRVERQIGEHERGAFTVSDASYDPIAANRKYSHWLGSQLIDLNEAIELTTYAAAQRNALYPA